MSFFGGIFSGDKWKNEARQEKKNAEKYLLQRDQWKQIGSKVREFAARRYLRGDGIEVGGLNAPLPVYEGAKVKYVDRMPTDALRKAYPELQDQALVDVDIVDDGEKLGTIGDGSQDFVIANHMLEHTQDPIRTVENFLRVLKPNGILFMAIPDKRFTFDRNRAITPYEHIKRDYLEGPSWSERAHFEDWVMQSPQTPAGQEARQRAAALMEKGTSIHFHVWTLAEMAEMFLRIRSELGFPFEIESMILNGNEVVTILRKSA